MERRARWKRRGKKAGAVLAGSAVVFAIVFTLWMRVCLDMQMIEGLAALRKSQDTLTTEMKEAREESLRWRRNSL